MLELKIERKANNKKYLPINEAAKNYLKSLGKKTFTENMLLTARAHGGINFEVLEHKTPEHHIVSRRPHYQIWYSKPQREYFGYFTDKNEKKIGTEFFGTSRERVLQLLLSAAQPSKGMK